MSGSFECTTSWACTLHHGTLCGTLRITSMRDPLLIRLGLEDDGPNRTPVLSMSFNLSQKASTSIPALTRANNALTACVCRRERRSVGKTRAISSSSVVVANPRPWSTTGNMNRTGAELASFWCKVLVVVPGRGCDTAATVPKFVTRRSI